MTYDDMSREQLVYLISEQAETIARLEWLNREERATIEHLAKMLRSAADTIEIWAKSSKAPHSQAASEAIIKQLREAAQ